MKGITIKQGEKILAQHTTDSPLSHYGQAVWIIEEEEPKPGWANWNQDGQKQAIEIVKKKAGWLICRQKDGFLVGILWSDGNYFADLLVDSISGEPCRELKKSGQKIRNTVQFDPEDSEDLGGIFV